MVNIHEQIAQCKNDAKHWSEKWNNGSTFYVLTNDKEALVSGSEINIQRCKDFKIVCAYRQGKEIRF